MYSKAKIFSLALNALLLSREVIDPDTDRSNECKILLRHYDIAFRSTLEDLDLDSTSDQANLELITEAPNDLWLFAYKYPQKCAFFRRIQSCDRLDDRLTFIDKQIRMRSGTKVILTDQEDAIGEFISYDVPLSSLTATAGLCVALKLAALSSALIVGKGADKLRQSIRTDYMFAKSDAQEQDRRENVRFNDPEKESEFVAARTS